MGCDDRATRVPSGVRGRSARGGRILPAGSEEGSRIECEAAIGSCGVDRKAGGFRQDSGQQLYSSVESVDRMACRQQCQQQEPADRQHDMPVTSIPWHAAFMRSRPAPVKLPAKKSSSVGYCS